MKSILKYSIPAILAALPIIPAIAQSEVSEDEPMGYYDLLLKVDLDDPQTDIDYLIDNGIKILNHRHEICIAFVPENLDIDAVLVNLPSLRQPENPLTAIATGNSRTAKKARRLSSLRNSALRALARAKKVRGLNQPAMTNTRKNYDLLSTLSHPEVTAKFPELSGKGVVVGFSDIGFDARHINFLSSDGSELRVKKAVQVNDSEGTMDIYETPEDILAWYTDNDDNFHATHVGGILAGGYTVNDMHGVAPGAEIVATTSQLTDCGILAGVEEVISYAKSAGKPAVVNLSLANYTGPHDGSSLFCQYLDRCAEDAAICVASGNEGASTHTVSLDLTPEKDNLLMMIAAKDWRHFDNYGLTDIYADDDRPLSISIQTLWYPVRVSNIFYESPRLDFSERSVYTLTSDPEKKDTEGYIYSEKWAEAMTGEIVVVGEVDPENGRYHVSVIYDTSSQRLASDKYDWAHYRTAIKVWGSPGQHIDAFADGSYSTFSKITGYTPDPNSRMSVNDLATGHNTISVGQYVAQEGVANLGGAIWGGGLIPMDICDSSGYATLIDGRVLPLTVAPGTPLVSSMSGAFIRKYDAESISSLKVASSEAYPADNGQGAAAVFSEDDGDTDQTEELYHYWGPYGGTSMASPYAAGVVALMKQINPDITSAEIIKRIQDSNDIENHPYAADPRNGQGYLDSSRLLLTLIRDIPTSVENISSGKASYILTAENDAVHIINPASHRLYVEIFSTDGRISVPATHSAEKDLTIPLTTLSPGIYIIKVSSPDAETYTLKIRK